MGIIDFSNLNNDLREIVAEIVELEPEEITPEADFVNDLGMDSMQALEILAAIEKKYSIQIPEEHLGKIINHSQLMELTTSILKVN